MDVSAMHVTRNDARWISALLALFLVVGGLPLSAGIVITSSSSQPSLSLDLCHPLEAAAAASLTTIARPAPAALRPSLRESNEALPEIVQFLLDLKIAPDTPPPKALS